MKLLTSNNTIATKDRDQTNAQAKDRSGGRAGALCMRSSLVELTNRTAVRVDIWFA
jgi:hypothetical protein